MQILHLNIMKKPTFEKPKFTKIMVEIDKELVNITDLPENEYELFLELTHKLRQVYPIIKSSTKIIKNANL